MHRSLWSRLLRQCAWVRGPWSQARSKKKRSGRYGLRTTDYGLSLERLEDRTLLSTATYTVNVLGDNGGAAGTQSGPTSGNLRWCINQADLPANSGSSIVFDPSVFDPAKQTTINLSNGELPISDNMTITGPGANALTISGTDGKGGGSRVFNITSILATVSISGMTIANGNAAVYYTPIVGNQGGDIFNGGNLTLTNDVVTNGFSSGTVGGPNGRGGAIFDAEGQNGNPGATLVLNNTIVENSTASGAGALGGGVFNDIGATLTLEGGSIVQNNQTTGGIAAGAGLYNKGTLSLSGAAGSEIIIEDNIAQGAPSSPAYGGGVYNSGTLNLQYAQFLGNRAIGGNGPNGFTPGGSNGTPGGPGGNGGNAQGGGIYNGVGALALSMSNTQFGVDGSGVGNEALGGTGGKGGNGAKGKSAAVGIPGGEGGTGGDGGYAEGGAIANLGGALSMSSTTFTDSEAIGGNGGNSGDGGLGGNSSNAGVPGAPGGKSPGAGAGGKALGGAVFNSQSNLTIGNSIFSGSRAIGGTGGAGQAGGDAGNGGNAGSNVPGGVGGPGGHGGPGGAGGTAQGGGFYGLIGTVSIANTTFNADAGGIGNEAMSGTGGAGGNGGTGGQGGDGSNTEPPGPGGPGGVGGDGAVSGEAEGGVGSYRGSGTQGGNMTLTSDTFISSLVTTGNGGVGGNGGNGGNSGNTDGPYGGAGGNAGVGGNAGHGYGGTIAVTASILNVNGDTFGGSSTNLGNQIIGGNGGAGGIGGTIGGVDHPPIGYAIASPIGQVNPAGNGGAGGAGASVNGGALSTTSTPLTSVNLLNNYAGLNFSQSGGYAPPVTQGAAGPNNFIETVNQELAIYSPKTTGASSVTDTFADFWYNQGKLSKADANSQLSDPTIIWDEQIQRFIIGDQDADTGTHVSTFDIAVSNSADPTSLTSLDWTFYQVVTTEPGLDAVSLGNMGWNHDALVFTLNMYQGNTIAHAQVDAISINALVNDLPLTPGVNAFQTDYSNGTTKGANLRPTVMHDSKAGDPMWFVQEGGNGNSINVVQMTNVLSSTSTFTTTNLPVLPYSTAVLPLQSDGTRINTILDSRIMKVAEQNGLLVAAHTVSDSAGDEDNVQWYVIDVSSGTPGLQQQGDITGGSGVYDFNPGIDINSQGDIGVSFAQATTAGQFMSMYVTGRTPTNATGTMQIPILVQAGLGNYRSFNTFGRASDLSGINVDSDGSFWAVNEFTDTEVATNWATEVAHFTVSNPLPPNQTVGISNSTFDNNSIASGAGGAGGQAGLFSLDGANQGLSGQGGAGGLAQGGTISLLSSTAQNGALDKDTIENSKATAGTGGAGAVNYTKAAFEFIQNWNGYGSNGGAGGSVEGIGLADVDYSLNVTSATFDNGVGTAGAGGVGGGASINVPRSWQGGAGGSGGSVLGGGVYLSNNLSAATPLSLTLNGGSASNITMTAGAGGSGGNAGASGSKSVAGGVGGAGGSAQGGGIYLLASSQSLNNVALSNFSLLGDSITAGTGGVGGAGYNATGGTGGLAQGGGVYSNSLNTTNGQASSLNILATTIAGNQVTGGNGGNAGSGTTPNGGAGGAGGNAGAADGAGVFNGTDTALTITNTTFGGTSNSSNPNAYFNVLTSGLGGRGGNAGTPAGVVSNNGGPGGAGGVIAGGNIYNASAGATLMDDTIVDGQAAITGLGGAGGSGAGNGGLPGAVGANGTATAGGYFAAPGSTNTIGNTILALNTAVTDPDASGSFTSLGSNLLSNPGSATGFNIGGSDQTVTAAQLSLGPLLNNGGPTLTDALLPNSVAIATGNVSLVPAGVTTDQRGPGFARINPVNNTVDVGAFEFNPPVITGLNPTSVVEGSPNLTLTVTGDNFVTGATVTFGSTVLMPTSSSSSTQLVVTVPASLLTTPGPVNVTVNVPDGSGVSGSTVSSAPMVFTIAPTPFTLNNPGTQQNFVGESVSLPITAATGFTASNFSATGLPAGLSIDANSGIISGTISTGADANSPYTVTVTASDTQGAQASVTFTWQVGPPLSLNNPGNQSNNEGDAVALLITAPGGFVPSGYLVTGLPPGLSINQSTGLISGTIDPRGTGTYNVTVTPANNGGQGGVSFTWTVADTTPPALTNPGNQTSKAGQTINLAIGSVDADSGSFTATGLPTGLSINSQGVITGTIAANTQGTYAVTVQAADGSVLSAPLSFLWTVSGSVSPPPPPGGGGSGGSGPTFTTIANVSNQYPGFIQVETVTVDVTSMSGAVVNGGVVAIQVDGQTVYAQVANGVASANVSTSLLDFALWPDLLFPHPLTAVYTDSNGGFASSSTSLTLPPIWLDFFLFELSLQLAPLNQLG